MTKPLSSRKPEFPVTGPISNKRKDYGHFSKWKTESVPVKKKLPPSSRQEKHTQLIKRSTREYKEGSLPSIKNPNNNGQDSKHPFGSHLVVEKVLEDDTVSIDSGYCPSEIEDNDMSLSTPKPTTDLELSSPADNISPASFNRFDPKRKGIRGNRRNTKSEKPFVREDLSRKAFRKEKNLTLDQVYRYKGPDASFNYLLDDFIKNVNPVENMGRNSKGDTQVVEVVIQSKLSRKLENETDKEIKEIKTRTSLPDEINPEARGISNEERDKRNLKRKEAFKPLSDYKESIQKKHELIFSSDLLSTHLNKHLRIGICKKISAKK